MIKEKRSVSAATSDDEIRITEFYEEHLRYFVAKLFTEHCFNRNGRTEIVRVGLFKKSEVKQSSVRDG